MFERFTTDARRTVTKALDEAKADGSSSIDPGHLLVAIAAGPGAGGEAMRGQGLDPETVRKAIRDEFEQSLAAVGVSLDGVELHSTPDPRRTPRFSAPSKGALERALKVAVARSDRRIISGHILLGLLRSPAGQVPRTLARAGVEPAELAARAETALDAAG